MTKSKIFLVGTIVWIGAVGLQSWRDFSFGNFPLLILAISLAAVFWKNKTAFLLAGFLLIFVLGVWRSENALSAAQENSLNGQKIQEKARVLKSERKETTQKIVVELEKSRKKVLLTENLAQQYSYGQDLEIECVLKTPENFDDNFDYRMYLAKDKIYYLGDKAKIISTDRWQGNRIYGGFLQIKKSLEKNIDRAISQPQAALANGMLFGGSGAMSEKMQEAFSRTGMTHIVAVSGFNVTIIAEYLVLVGIFLGLWRNQALWAALIGIFIFVAMIGFPASAVRAGVMGAVLIWAMKSGRLANSLNAIFLAGAVMLWFNPLLLRYDVGFQLSFLATLGIVLFAPLAEKISLKKYDFGGIGEIIFLTLCAQILVWPIIAFNFQTVSLISLLANILILPVIPLAMLFSFLAALSGFFLPDGLNAMAWLAFLILDWEIKVIEFLGSFSWASRELGSFSVLGVVSYYLILAFIFFLIKLKTKINDNEKS